MARILVVGAEEWCVRTSSALSAAGHRVTSSHDALDAAELALGSSTAAIVTQRLLTGPSGLQLCRLVQAQLPLEGIPVVVMSGSEDLGGAFQARAAGATAHVDDVEGLLRVLPAILTRSQRAPNGRRVRREELERRLSVVLDGALRDGEIAADVRALASVDSLEGMFEGLVALASQVLPYTWLGLVAGQENPSFLLHAGADDDDAERTAREVLGVDAGTPCVTSRGAVPREAPALEVAREPFEVPIFFGDSQVGQLAVALPPSRADDVKRTVALVAYELGGPLKIMSLLEQVRRQAATDTLTALMTRRAFLETIARETARSARSGVPTSFLMVDIDHFKRVNDLHGHPAGDAVLRGVARSFARSTRATDLLCRWGGEEFVVALPRTGLDAALVTAERIRAELEATAHVLPLGGSLVVTASIGVATGVPPWSIEHVLAEADAALYEAKSAGRNRVRASPGDADFAEVPYYEESLRRAS